MPHIHIHIAFVAILAIVSCVSGHVHDVDEAAEHFLEPGQHLEASKVLDSPLLTSKIKANRTIKVDINGNGDFTRVQDAINAVPANNSEWIIIHVRKGVYR